MSDVRSRSIVDRSRDLVEFRCLPPISEASSSPLDSIRSFLEASPRRFSPLLLRNVVWKQPYANTNVIQASDAIRIQVTVPRPWRVRAGEYIYIWIPGASFWSPFQSHPFMISWWDNIRDGRSITIYLLVKPAAEFSQELIRHAGNGPLKSWIEGPYD